MRAATDVDSLTSWHSEWSGLRVAVLGLGVTGFSAADTLVELGAEVVVISESADPGRADLLTVIGARLEVAEDSDDGVRHLREFDPDLVIVSPGFAPTHPFVVAAQDSTAVVWGDVELAWRVRDKIDRQTKWITVTGTNGKTTTVRLAAAMIGAGGARVIACGNVGVPVLDAIRDPDGFDVLVVELSSFQLHYTSSISAHASVCLNIAADHLDWHGSAAAYNAAKGRIYENTRVACVYNRDDDATRAMVERADVVDGCRAIGFGLGVPGPSDIGIVDDIVCDRAFHNERSTSAIELATLSQLDAVGLSAPHMVSNVLAAAALARSVDTPAAAIRQAVREFRVDEHRIATVATGAGVAWVDDSKATNSHAADAALAAFPSVVWVIGGLLKGASIDELIVRHAARLRAAVVIGVDRKSVLSAFGRHAPLIPVFEVDTIQTGEVMPMAVRLAAAVAKPGDTVLLAPAAASMDQFVDYADRGRRFAAAVHEMLGGRPNDDQHPATPGPAGGQPPASDQSPAH